MQPSRAELNRTKPEDCFDPRNRWLSTMLQINCSLNATPLNVQACLSPPCGSSSEILFIVATPPELMHLNISGHYCKISPIQWWIQSAVGMPLLDEYTSFAGPVEAGQRQVSAHNT